MMNPKDLGVGLGEKAAPGENEVQDDYQSDESEPADDEEDPEDGTVKRPSRMCNNPQGFQYFVKS